LKPAAGPRCACTATSPGSWATASSPRWCEALHLVETGVADAAAVDAVIQDGPALRWATIGNFGANHTNAEGGIAEYFARYGEAYRSMMANLDSAPPKVDSRTLDEIALAVERREGVRGPQDLARKRDRMVKELLRLRSGMR